MFFGGGRPSSERDTSTHTSVRRFKFLTFFHPRLHERDDARRGLAAVARARVYTAVVWMSGGS